TGRDLTSRVFDLDALAGVFEIPVDRPRWRARHQRRRQRAVFFLPRLQRRRAIDTITMARSGIGLDHEDAALHAGRNPDILVAEAALPKFFLDHLRISGRAPVNAVAELGGLQ